MHVGKLYIIPVQNTCDSNRNKNVKPTNVRHGSDVSSCVDAHVA